LFHVLKAGFGGEYRASSRSPRSSRNCARAAGRHPLILLNADFLPDDEVLLALEPRMVCTAG
jgi:hypothetical protein